MPRNEEKDKQQRNERRTQIQEAAIRVFSRKGISTNMSSIAAEAKLSHSHIYNYFRSKEELLMSIAMQSQDNYSLLLAQSQQQPGSAHDRLLNVLSHFSSFDKADNYLILLQIQFSEVLPESEKNKLKARARSNLSQLTELIRQGQQEGSIRQGNAMELATLFTNLMMSMVLHEMRGFDKSTPDTIQLIMTMFEPGNAESGGRKKD